jgi:hypothetical protein
MDTSGLISCESDGCFNGCRAKQTPEHLLMSCRTYRLERQSMIRVAKQHKDEPGPLKRKQKLQKKRSKIIKGR